MDTLWEKLCPELVPLLDTAVHKWIESKCDIKPTFGSGGGSKEDPEQQEFWCIIDKLQRLCMSQLACCEGDLELGGQIYNKLEVFIIGNAWIYLRRATLPFLLIPTSRLIEASYAWHDRSLVVTLRLRYWGTLTLENLGKHPQGVSSVDDVELLLKDIRKSVHNRAIGCETYTRYISACLKQRALIQKGQPQTEYKSQFNLEKVDYLLRNHNAYLVHKTGDNPFLARIDQSNKLIIPSYPEVFISAQTLDNPKKRDSLLGFHEHKRAPALSIPYTAEGSGKQTAIWRSAQIKPSMLKSVCSEENELLTVLKSVGQQKQLINFDCRSQKNMLGKMLGKDSFLDSKNYKVDAVIYGALPGVQDLKKDMESLERDKNYDCVSNWLVQISAILSGATFVRDKILEGTSVIVNCSDGWDRTPQIICLTKIMLEPYFRTIEGFQTLIHYEWNCFGHKFKSRQYFLDSSEASPVFIQFLDCVYQLVIQFPEKFEFNSDLVFVLAKSYIENCFIEFNFDNTEQYKTKLQQDYDNSKSVHTEFEFIDEKRPKPVQKLQNLFGKQNVVMVETENPRVDQELLFLPDKTVSLSVWSLIYAQIKMFENTDYEYAQKKDVKNKMEGILRNRQKGIMEPEGTTVKRSGRTNFIMFDEARELLYDYLFIKPTETCDVIKDFDRSSQSLEYWKEMYCTGELRAFQGRHYVPGFDGASFKERTDSNDFCMLPVA